MSHPHPGIPYDKVGSLYYYGGYRLREPDPVMETLLSRNGQLARMLRIVGGNSATGEPKGWSKHPRDVFTLDGQTLGLAHFATGNAHDMWTRAVALGCPSPRTKMEIDDPACVQWWLENAETGPVLRSQVELWVGDVLPPALASFRRLGWSSARGLATLARSSNTMASYPEILERYVNQVGSRLSESQQVELALEKYKEGSSSGARRRALIRGWFPAEERVDLAQWNVDSLNWKDFGNGGNSVSTWIWVGALLVLVTLWKL